MSPGSAGTPLTAAPNGALSGCGAVGRAGGAPSPRARAARAVVVSAFAAGAAWACGAQAQAAAVPPAVPAGAITYQIDPEHTFVTFEVRHFGTSTLRGRIGPMTGQVTIDRAGHAGDLRLRIPVATVSTGVGALDARLRQPDLLATTEYPEAYFIATQFRFDAASGVKEVRGEFILRGVSEPLSLYARQFACRHDERSGREVCGGDFDGDLKRSRFGATYGEPFVGDDVHLVVQVEAIAP